MKSKKGVTRFMSYCPLVLLFRPQGGDIAHFEKHCFRCSTSTNSDNDRDASLTRLSDSFLAVCSHNQSDEDLAMSIKYRGVPFASPSQTVDANAYMHEELMEHLIHYDTTLPSSHERI